jgi:hypothetical protein
LQRIIVDPKYLIPTDCPRSLTGVLRFVPILCAGKYPRAIVVVPAPMMGMRDKTAHYLVCSGNHRAAAAYICEVALAANVVASDDDLAEISDGTASGCESVEQLVASCLEAAESGGYLKGRWEEYLRMITDSGVVGYDEQDTAQLSESALRRGARRAP